MFVVYIVVSVGVGGWLVLVGGATRCGIIRKFAYIYHSCHIFIMVGLLGW